MPRIFRTRKQANDFIREKYGYIAVRKDLRNEPHGWRLPKAIKVTITPTMEVSNKNVSFTILGSYWLDTPTGIKSAIRNFYQEKRNGKTKPSDVRL